MNLKEIAEINYEEGLRRFSSNEALYKKFLLKFSEDTSLDDAKAALESDDSDAFFKAIHTLKGISGNLSITGLYNASCSLVDAIRADDQAAFAELFEKVKREHRKIVDILKKAE